MTRNYYDEVVENIDELSKKIRNIKDKKRVAVWIPTDMHVKIKANAAYRNIDFRDYLIRALAKELALDKDLGL